MHSFHYRDGHLYCEDVDLTRVAGEFGTPTYVYSAETIVDHYKRLDAALAPLDHLICYAVKANSNRAILDLLVRSGAGFDIVSGGELFRVLAAGGDPAKCTFAGVGKSDDIACDSAEIKSVHELYAMGWNVHGPRKAPIVFGLDILLRYKINVTARSVNIIKELRNYKWAVDKEGEPVKPPKPIDAFNHAIDAMRYLAVFKLSQRKQGMRRVN